MHNISLKIITGNKESNKEEIKLDLQSKFTELHNNPIADKIKRSKDLNCTGNYKIYKGISDKTYYSEIYNSDKTVFIVDKKSRFLNKRDFLEIAGVTNNYFVLV